MFAMLKYRKSAEDVDLYCDGKLLLNFFQMLTA